MLKKFLATASVAGLLAGGAHALEVEARALGADAAGEPVVLASALDYAGGAVTSSGGQTAITFYPTAGLFPTGNVLIHVNVTGGVFDGALDGSEVTGTGTSVISQGGQNGANSVVFLVSGSEACNAPDICTIDLPLVLDGSNVSFSVGLQTDAGAPVDNSSATNRVSAQVVRVAPAFSIAVAADTVATIADLNAATGPFTDFTGPSDRILGTYSVGGNSVLIGANSRPVNRNLDGDDVDATDVASVDLTLTGTMAAFETLPGDVLFGGASADDISAASSTATYDAIGDFDSGPTSIEVIPDLVTAIARSAYNLAITVVPAPGSPLTAGTSGAGALQSIERNGTQITFPWTQSATQGAGSGTTSVFRFGNTEATAAGAVFVEVKNTSEPLYSNPGLVQIAPSIPANGELVRNSTQLEAALGNYGRGDLEFTIEAEPGTLTGRQFVVRSGVIQQVIGGTIEQDLQ